MYVSGPVPDAADCITTGEDVLDCGTPNRVCNQATCSSGVCRSLAKIQILSGLTHPMALAVDGAHVYYADDQAGTVGQVDRDGSNPTVLATGQATPAGIAVDAQYVYWSAALGGRIWRVPIGGGSPAVVTGANAPSGVAVDGSSVYWVDAGGAEIRRLDMSTGVSGLLYGPTSAGYFISAHLVFTKSYLYFTVVPGTDPTAGTAYRMPKNGGAATTPLVPLATTDLFQAPLPGGIVCGHLPGNTRVFHDETVERCVWEDGSSLDILLGLQTSAGAPVGKDSRYLLYATRSYPALARSPLCGGHPVNVIGEIIGGSGDVVVDGKDVFFAAKTYIGHYVITG